MEYAFWNNKEVQALISIWGNEDIQRQLESVIRNKKVYQMILQHLAKMGIQHKV